MKLSVALLMKYQPKNTSSGDGHKFMGYTDIGNSIQYNNSPLPSEASTLEISPRVLSIDGLQNVQSWLRPANKRRCAHIQQGTQKIKVYLIAQTIKCSQILYPRFKASMLSMPRIPSVQCFLIH